MTRSGAHATGRASLRFLRGNAWPLRFKAQDCMYFSIPYSLFIEDSSWWGGPNVCTALVPSNCLSDGTLSLNNAQPRKHCVTLDYLSSMDK